MTNKNTSEKVFKTSEVAEICGVHLRTVIRWIERGELDAYQLPGRGDNRITEASLKSFLKKNQIPMPKEWVSEKKQILIVDDDHLMAGTINRVLRRAGYETYVANDGFQAGILLSSLRPDLVTLDLKMPGMDGFQVLDFIRQQTEHADLKILIVSALDVEELEKAVEAGANAYVQKPFRNQFFLDEVNKLIK